MESDEDDYDTDDGDLDDETLMQHDSSNNSCTDELRGLVGLQNLGNTCYMNGALQALSNCQQLTRFVLDCPGFIKDTGLSRSYSELIKEIWDSRGCTQYAAPTSIIRNIRCIYPAFRGCTQQDTQEFLRCFLEQLHDELKQPVINSNKSNKLKNHDATTPSASPVFQSSSSLSSFSLAPSLSSNESLHGGSESIRNDAGGETDRDTSDVQRSIISDTFEFKISSSVVCSSCNNISTTKETFKDLSVPIPTKDHPYYQRDNFQDNDALDAQKFATSSSSSLEDCIASCIASPTDANDVQKQDNKKDKATENSNFRSREDGDEIDSDEEACQTVQRVSYIDSIPLARWFISWFSQLGDWFWGPQVSLQDCLSIFFGSDPLEGDNEYSCDVCTKKNKGVKYLKILELPEVLCIHFKRYGSIGSAKITTHVSFPLTGLDLAPFMSPNSRPQCSTYNLIACICHHGPALLNGHYTTYALNCYDDQWYEFDDQYVTNVSSYQVENSEAYILFYQKSTLDGTKERQRIKASMLLKKSLQRDDMRGYFISKQWVNKFNTFVEPGPITNFDFLCKHVKVPQSKQSIVGELCHPISESVWKYLMKLHGGGPECCDLVTCDVCE